jgi:flagellar hook-associated protein 1 FlgK
VTNEKAFDALLDQSSAWHESISGVNLDEEAANLVKFQQAYSAAARVISVAQQTFETLLGAVR